MSIPIVTAPRDPEDVSIACPRELARIFLPRVIDSINRKLPVAISKATENLLVFKVAVWQGNSHSASGNHTFSTKWKTYSVTKSQLLTETQIQVFELIGISAQVWGPAAETALEFIVHTLE